MRLAAAAAGVPLTAVTVSKEKSNPSRKFGIANAINTAGFVNAFAQSLDLTSQLEVHIRGFLTVTLRLRT